MGARETLSSSMNSEITPNLSESLRTAPLRNSPPSGLTDPLPPSRASQAPFRIATTARRRAHSAPPAVSPARRVCHDHKQITRPVTQASGPLFASARLLPRPALRGIIALRVPARPHPRPRCARLRNRRRRAPRPDPRPHWCLHAQCGVQSGLGVVESQQAGLGLLYMRAVLSYYLLLWSYRDMHLELSSLG